MFVLYFAVCFYTLVSFFLNVMCKNVNSVELHENDPKQSSWQNQVEPPAPFAPPADNRLQLLSAASHKQTRILCLWRENV